MKSLKSILEGVLDTGFDITDDDINPVKLFVDKYRAKGKRYGYRYLKGGWTVDELCSILNNYGEFMGTVQSFDFVQFLISANRSKHELIVMVAPYSHRPEFYIFDPHKRSKIWDMYTCDPNYYDSALLKALPYRDEDIIRMFKTKVPVKVYKLRDDRFLKELQKHVTDV